MPLLKRHKILLGIILNAGGKPTKTELMKWIFLLKKETILKNDNSFYDFVPYEYGPFSFTLYRDLAELIELGYLEKDGFEINSRFLNPIRDIYQEIPKSIRADIDKIIRYYSRLDLASLIDHVYDKYPWFAHRSKLKPTSRNYSEEKINVLYTIGYEGKSIDSFLQYLIKFNIRLLVDVRNNPVSRKYGFSKSSLSRLCNDVDVEYIHFPDLGVPSSLRSSLETPEDYQNLLNKYENEILPQLEDKRKQAEQCILEKSSALVCFEADVRNCHRGRLAKALAQATGQTIKHL